MKNKKIPGKISDYIKKNFREEFLFELKDVRRVKNQWIYNVEISKDDVIHTLSFDEEGRLISAESVQAFASNSRDQDSFEEVPE